MPVQYSQDYYQTLGVAKTASQDDIRKAFRKLARQHHPDVAKDKKTAEAKFKEINEAYEVLSDAEKRKRYDELGADWDRPGGPRRTTRGDRPEAEAGLAKRLSGGTGFSDFFEQFFSGGASRGRGGFSGFGMQPEMPGSDIEADLLVTIEEALHGAKKKISFSGAMAIRRSRPMKSAFRKACGRDRKSVSPGRAREWGAANKPAICISSSALKNIPITRSKAAI